MSLCIAGSATASSAPGAAARPDAASQIASSLGELAAMEARVAPIIQRLVTGSAHWCPQRMPVPGWLLGDQRLYSSAIWPAAKKVYGVGQGDGPFIAALDPGGAAARAGLRQGDVLLAIGADANAWPTAPLAADKQAAPHARMAAAHQRLTIMPPDVPLLIRTARLADPVTVLAEVGCASEFRVEASEKVGAQADGSIVAIPAGMIRFARAEDELATVIAHELSHNILRHRERLNAANIQWGLARNFGRNARLTRATEIEADRLSVWLLAGAGYDPAAAVRFWTDFGKRRGGGIFRSATHPKWRERVAIVTEEAKIMNPLLATDRLAHPPLLTNLMPLE